MRQTHSLVFLNSIRRVHNRIKGIGMRAINYKLPTSLVLLAIGTALLFQNCSGLITGNPIRYEKVNLRFLTFNEKSLNADVCLTNLRLRVDTFGKDNASNEAQGALNSLLESSGFDISYFYQEKSSGKYIINGLFKNKNLKLNSEGTDIGGINLPVAIYDEVTFGFSTCGENLNPSVLVTKDNIPYADSKFSAFAKNYTETRDLKTSSGSGFEIKDLTYQLNSVGPSNNVPNALTSFRQYFNLVGMTSTYLPNHTDISIDEIAIMDDGRRVLLSRAKRNGNNVLVLTRYLANATLDANFGTNAYVSIKTNVDPGGNSALAVDADGNIFVSRRYYENGNASIGVLKLQSNGSPDLTWGTRGDGWILKDLGEGERSQDILLLNDGILVAANTTDEFEPGSSQRPIFLIKLGSDGSTNWTSRFAYTPADHNYRILLALNNQIINLAYTNNKYPGNDVHVAQFDLQGNYIKTNIIDFGSWGGRALDMIIQSDDHKILIVGAYGQNSSSYDLMAARLMTDGQIDSGFGANGIYTLPIPGREYARGAVRYYDTQSASYQIILGGAFESPLAIGYATAQLQDNGNLLDTQMIRLVETDGPLDIEGGPISIDNDGKSIALGGASANSIHLLIIQ